MKIIKIVISKQQKEKKILSFRKCVHMKIKHLCKTTLFIIINYFTQNISPFLIGSNPLANSSQPAGIDQGPICTSKKVVLDKFSVITNALQMRMVCPQMGEIFKGNEIT